MQRMSYWYFTGDRGLLLFQNVGRKVRVVTKVMQRWASLYICIYDRGLQWKSSAAFEFPHKAIQKELESYYSLIPMRCMHKQPVVEIQYS